MGREALCVARIDSRELRGKAHLASNSLDFSGETRFSLPFADVRQAVADDGWLRLATARGEVALALGKAATAWAEAIRNPKSRLDKLGIKPGMRVYALGLPEAAFLTELTRQLGTPPEKSARGRFDAILRGLETARDLGAIAKLRERLLPEGALWLVYRKGKAAPLPERLVREALLAADLVDVKVVAFSDSHTAVKAVIPLAQRAASSGGADRLRRAAHGPVLLERKRRPRRRS